LLATALGAEVLNSVDDGKGATHVVAHAGTGDGDGRRTDKVKWAAKTPGASAVSADWLAKCADEWARVDESRYSLLGPDSGTLKVRDEPVVDTGGEDADVTGSPPGSPGYSA
jgi:hypothetical protein